MKMDDLKKLSNAELLTIYNTHATKQINRFSDRSAALRRTAHLLESLGSKPQIDAPAPPSLAMEGKKSRAKVLVAEKDHPNDKAEFASVKKAFIAMKLPLGVHKKFRRKLKLAGEAEIGNFIFTATYKEKK